MLINHETIRRNALEMQMHHSDCRYGQSIFNASAIMYKDESSVLAGTEYDCFYDDEKVEVFLDKLNEVVNIMMK